MKNLSTLLKSLLRVRPYEVELLRPSGQVPPLSWIFLALGVCALAGAALVCAPAWSRHGEIAQQRLATESALAALQADSASRAGAKQHTSASRAVATEDLAEAEGIVAELHRPWHNLFDQLESAQAAEGAGVHLQQLAVDPRFVTVQLVAEGRDLDKIVRFSQRLSSQEPDGGPVRSMNMTHHEWRDTLGAHVVSVALQGDLRTALPPASGSNPP